MGGSIIGRREWGRSAEYEVGSGEGMRKWRIGSRKCGVEREKGGIGESEVDSGLVGRMD